MKEAVSMLYFAVGLERIREEEENEENEENTEKGTENEASNMGKESTPWTREQRDHTEKDKSKETTTTPGRRRTRRGGDDSWRKPSTIERNALFLAGKVHARRGEIREAIATLTSLAHRQSLGWTGPHSTKRYVLDPLYYTLYTPFIIHLHCHIYTYVHRVIHVYTPYMHPTHL